MDAFRGFHVDMSNYPSALAAFLIVRLILTGVLTDKKQLKEIVIVVWDLLFFIFICYFTFKYREYMLDDFGYKVHFVWLLMIGLLVLNVKDIYSLIKSKSSKEEKQRL
jgi:asparagine N-glycosylation enzyme membrane subunit Stt3